jgi:anti-anti-sigma factor
MGIQNCSENVLLVELSGEPKIPEELRAAAEVVREKHNCDVIIDFSNVDIVTSSSLSKLLQLRKSVCDCGRQLVLCSLGCLTKSIFVVTSLDNVFQIVGDKHLALAALNIPVAGSCM